MTRWKFLIVFFVAANLLLLSSIAFAQLPAISYTPATNVFTVNSPVGTLSPANTGGAVPATTYSTVSTLAASTTNINNPRGLTADGAGNIYETDFGGNLIYKINSAGTVTVFAGTGAAAELDANGTSAKFNGPTGIVYDGSAYLYVTDNTGNTIRRISIASPYTVTTIAGSGANAEHSANGTAASFAKPYGIDYDGAGNLYVTDNGGNVVRKVSTVSPYAVTLIAGTTAAAEFNSATGSTAKFNGPTGIVYDGSGNLYVTDQVGNTVRKVSTSSPFAVSTFAGSGAAGSLNATGTSATFKSPYGITMDASDNLIVADEGNNLIRTITPGGVVTTLAGDGTRSDLNGTATGAEFFSPYAITADNAGNIYTGDDNGASSTVRKIQLTGYVINALPAGLIFDGTTGAISGTPTGVSAATVYTVTAFNASGSASANITISVVLPSPPVISYSPSTNSYVVGTAIATLSPANSGGPLGSFGYGTGTPYTGAALLGASGMGIDASNNIYITNFGNNTISEYNSSGGYVGTFGTGSTAMSEPVGIVFDSSGNAYVLNTGNGSVYKYNSSGVYQSTIITGFNHPLGIAIDASNFLYVTDYNFGTGGSPLVQKYNTAGTLQSLTIPTAKLNAPDGVVVDASGNIYVLNRGANNVVKYNSSGTYQSTIVASLNSAFTISMDGAGRIYVGDSGNGIVDVYDLNGTTLAQITGLTDPEGLVADPRGNLYVSDYTDGTVIKYPLIGGYFISAILPAGLSFNSTTGAFTGTPTVAFAATTYTVTAYNAGGSGSTTVTLSAGQQNNWVGNASSNWNTAGNWSKGTVPTSTDQALIGASVPFVTPPVISANTSVGSIILGTVSGTAPGISVGSGFTLAVGGDITYQSDNQAYRNLTATLSGSGAITAKNLNVIANTTLAGHPYTEALASSITSLSLSGNVSLTSQKVGTDIFNSTFNVTGGITSVTGILQTTNTAGSTSTISVTGATLQLANSAALSGLSSLGTNVVTFNNTGATIQYSGAAQTVYTAASITGLSSGVSYMNISFSGSGIKTVSTGNLNVSGNFTNTLANDASNYVAFTSPVVNFNGTTQSLAGGAGNGTAFYNVTFSGAGIKTLASGGFNVASTGMLTMASSAVLATGGLLTLKSDTSGTATVAQIPTGSSITGNVTVQRFVSGSAIFSNGRWIARNYRIMSSPVNEGVDGNGNYPCSLNYLGASTIITDCTSTYSTTPGNPSLYLYNETYTPRNTSFTSGNFVGITNISNTIATGHITTTDAVNGSAKVYVGGGYMLYFRGDKLTHLTGAANKTKAPYVAPESVVFSTTGALNQGTYSVVSWTGYGGLLYTNSNAGNLPVRGYNLVGNPYASTIDWSTFSSTNSAAAIYGPNVNPTVYLFNPRTSNYDNYNALTGIATGSASKYIPSGQGFFVQSSTHGSALTFTEAAKVNTVATGPSLFLGKPVEQAAYNSYLRLNLMTDTVTEDDMVVGLHAASTTKYNPEDDAEQLSGISAPGSISGLTSDNIKASVKWLPLPTTNLSQVINLDVAVTQSGLYKIARTDLKGIPAIYEVWLMDNYKKDSLDIRKNTTYAFNVDVADTNSYGSKRFQVVLRENPSLGMHLLSFNASKAAGGSEIVWKTENEQNYTNFTVQRSTDNGATFNVIGGFSSSSEGTYSFLDTKPANGDNMYRLQIEDLNDAVTYSNVVTLTYGDMGASTVSNIVSVYPNPTKAILNIAINTDVKVNLMATQSIGANVSTSTAGTVYGIKIVNNTGGVIKTATTAQPGWQTDVSNLMPGTYVIQVIDNGNKSVIGRGTFVKL